MKSAAGVKIIVAFLALTLQASLVAPCAWPTPLPQAGCHGAAKGQPCCCPAKASGEVPDCCQVKTPTPQAVVLVAPPPAPDPRLVTMADAGEVVEAIAAAAARHVLARGGHVPLKLPHDPTYLRISVLLI